MNRRQMTAFVAAALIFLAGCSTKSANESGPEKTPPAGTVERPAVPVHFARVEHRSLTGAISAGGEVLAGAGAQADLTFPTAGQIASVDVSIGDRVSRGEVLARLDNRLAQRDVAQASADVSAAQAELAKTRAGARPQELAQNRALVAGADAKARTARAELQRQQSLAAVGIASRRDVEQAQAAYADAAADLRDKQEAGSLLIAGPRVADIDVARAELERSRSSLATAQTRAALLTIVAPFDGIVTTRTKGPGEVVDTTTNVLAIVDPAKAVVAVRLSEDQSTGVKTGDRATITINGSPTTFAGTVSTVNASLDPETRTLQAFIMPNSATVLRPGATAAATIIVRTAADAYVVPARALVRDPDTGQPLVFEPLAGGSYRRIAVRVALESAGFAAIRSPQLRRVSRVVTDGAYELLPYAISGDSD